MNNKGFAISSIIYGILIIFLILIFSVLSILVNRGNTLSKVKENAINMVKGVNDTDVSMDALIADFGTMNINNEASTYIPIDYNLNVYSPYDYDIVNSVSGSTITYTAYDGTTPVITLERSLNNNAAPKVDIYEYNGNYQEILLNPGLYRLEAYAGETSSKGNYASGLLYLKNRAIVYLYVGGMQKGNVKGFNNSSTHIAYKKGFLNDIDETSVILAASNNNITSGVIEGSSEVGVQTGNGLIKITSLIYYSKDSLSYCRDESITSFKDCLIRSDSKQDITNAIKTIDARTKLADFSKTEPNGTTSNPGLYAGDDDYTVNANTKTYYYRGAVTNNWVKFGDYLWRIVRINGDGSIRMIYSGLASAATHTGNNAIIKNSYYGIVGNYSKTVTDLYDATKTVTISYNNGRYGNTYGGYMYNPERVFMTYPDKNVGSATANKLDKFPTYNNISNTATYYFVKNFNPATDCDQSTTEDAGTCILKCRKLGNDGDTGIDCVKSNWNTLATNNYSTTAAGSVSNLYVYTSPYKYTCWSDAKVVEKANGDGTTSVYISCPIVSEVVGRVNNQATKVKYHGLFSKDDVTSNMNVKDSNAKIQLDTWYATNILGKNDGKGNMLENYLSDEIFCNDRSSIITSWPLNGVDSFAYGANIRNYGKKTPSFKCLSKDGKTFNSNDSFTLKTEGNLSSSVTPSGKGNKMLTYPIGLITADEVVYGGGKWGKGNPNTSYWLSIGTAYWTLSPSDFHVYTATMRVTFVSGDGHLDNPNTSSNLGLRPVINLKPGVMYAGGSGTETDPYIVTIQ